MHYDNEKNKYLKAHFIKLNKDELKKNPKAFTEKILKIISSFISSHK